MNLPVCDMNVAEEEKFLTAASQPPPVAEFGKPKHKMEKIQFG